MSFEDGRKRGAKVKDWSDWPKPCLGTCGRMVRPPHAELAKYPNTVLSVSGVSQLCATCYLAKHGVNRHTGVSPAAVKHVEPEEQRLERMRRDYEALVNDRRRRGVPPEGVLMPGEKPDHLDRQRAVPPETLKPTPEAPLGFCPRGHAYDTQVERANGKKLRWCTTCHRASVAADKLKKLNSKAQNGMDRRPSPDAPLGRCMQGHPYTSVNGQERRKYCGICKKQREKVRRSKRAKEAKARLAAGTAQAVADAAA